MGGVECREVQHGVIFGVGRGMMDDVAYLDLAPDHRCCFVAVFISSAAVIFPMLKVHSVPSALKLIKLGLSFGRRVRNTAWARLFGGYQTVLKEFSEAGLIKKQDRTESVLVALIRRPSSEKSYVNYVGMMLVCQVILHT